MLTAKSQSISVSLHVLALGLLLILSSRSFSVPSPVIRKPVHEVLLAPAPVRLRAREKSGGGSNVSGAEARRGVAPPRSFRTFIPPATHPDPEIVLTPTIDFDVPALNVAGVYGDPLGSVASGLYGNKGGHGIGDAPGGVGIGPGPGGDGVPGRLGSPIQPAQVIYRVDPEFSEDARKARFQGMVVLMIEIGVDGRAHNAKVVEGAGLGLDEKAIEAVEQWRFRPARRGKTPLVTTARVEVYFHLL